MFKGHYIDWQNSRLNTINKFLSIDFFKNKSVHELGCGCGYFGNKAYLQGATSVTCSDARIEYENMIDKNLKFKKVDCDGPIDIDPVDVIIHFGVLYHIKKVSEHINSLSNLTKYIILESEVCDDNNYNIINVNENGYDQAYNGIESRPSQSYIEEELTKANFNYKCIKDSMLNTSNHIYDWEPINDKSYCNGKRRFWICWKNNIESPLII